MKRVYVEENQHHHRQPDPTNMFNNLHHHHPEEDYEETDTHSPTSRRNDHDFLPLALPPPLPPSLSNEDATVEVSRRPRGRPPGSKNKPKPPVIITSEASEPPMSPYVLELPPGVDIIESTTRFCRKRSIGLCILNGNGAVTNVTLKQPSTTPGSTVTFHGKFEVLSITATILPAGCAAVAGGGGQFAISLAGPQGQVVGGLVVGPLVAAVTIYLIAATFNSPSFHILQSFDHDHDSGTGEDGRVRKQAAVSGGGDGNPARVHGFCSYQANSDAVLAPTARPPPY